jgi:hypothetical protein
MNAEDMLNATEPFKCANGRIMTGREYLDQFIRAFHLKPCDYYTAHFLLQKLADGADIDTLVEVVKGVWDVLDNADKRKSSL